MRILIIGGTGFIGKKLLKRLAKDGHEIVAIARKQPHFLFPKNVLFKVLNRKDHPTFSRFFEKKCFDVIYDLAAFNATDISRALEVFSKINAHYVFVSSAAVYGEHGENLLESSTSKPIAWHKYGNSKWQAEQQMLKYSKSTIIRPTVVYGPNNPFSVRAYYFFRRIYHQIPLLVPGELKVKNHYVYVDDLVELLYKCLHFNKKNIINAPGAEIFTWKTYMDVLAGIMKKNVPPVCELKMSLQQFRNWQDCKKMQFYHNAFADFTLNTNRGRELDWSPKFSLTKALEATWDWIQKNDMENISAHLPIFTLERELFAKYNKS